jgi:hypothetical protein
LHCLIDTCRSSNGTSRFCTCRSRNKLGQYSTCTDHLIERRLGACTSHVLQRPTASLAMPVVIVNEFVSVARVVDSLGELVKGIPKCRDTEVNKTRCTIKLPTHLGRRSRSSWVNRSSVPMRLHISVHAELSSKRRRSSALLSRILTQRSSLTFARPLQRVRPHALAYPPEETRTVRSRRAVYGMFEVDDQSLLLKIRDRVSEYRQFQIDGNSLKASLDPITVSQRGGECDEPPVIVAHG